MAKSLVSAIISRNSRDSRKLNVFLFNNAFTVVSRNFSATSAYTAGAKLTPTEVSLFDIMYYTVCIEPIRAYRLYLLLVPIKL